MAIVNVSKSVALKAPADQVWAFVSDFGGYAAWQPHIASVELRPDGDRLVNFTRGDSVFDRISAKDDAARTLTYGLVPGQKTPMTKLEATFTVTGSGAGSDVEYAIEVDVPDQMQDAARAGIGADIDGALAGLDAKFNG
ncbi:SRPBCC family protein [Streptomyces hokutonensis]|uniref:SRPBCC family protein n=1 Tax=Streptomyces hokutonensis TaxID=1306990 RepID=UPI0003660574|nr:SRPBCC family protein [Streptomyces hokutonensis]